MRIPTAALCAAVLAVGAAPVLAPAAAPGEKDLQALQAENQQLRQRVSSLEEKVQQLLEVAQPPAVDADKATGGLTRRDQEADLAARYKKMLDAEAERLAKQPGNVWSSVDVQLYGKIKADAAFDTARTSVGNFNRWVLSEGANANDSTFNLTANETRLGLKFTGPTIDGMATRGVVEMDFFGGGAENKPNPMLRHGYLELAWAKSGFSLLAGQTWDLISPLNPTTLNYNPLWWVGNIGYRRAQIRATGVLCPWDGAELKLAGGIFRTIGQDGPFDPGDAGEDSGLPGFQGRAGLTFPLWGGRKTTVGVSGHYAKEEYDLDAAGNHTDLHSWSANLDVQSAVTDWLTIKGEVFTGEDLNAYLGGIGQGVAVVGTDLRELRSFGGWVAAGLGPWGPWSFNVGFGGETICNDSDATAGMRLNNRAIFGNALYKFNDHVTTGVELSHWHTGYKSAASGDSLRVQWSFIYSF